MFCRADALACPSSPLRMPLIPAAHPNLRNAISPRSPTTEDFPFFSPCLLSRKNCSLPSPAYLSLRPCRPSVLRRRPTRHRPSIPTRAAEDGTGDHHLSLLPCPAPAHPPPPPLPHPRHGLMLLDARLEGGSRLRARWGHGERAALGARPGAHQRGAVLPQARQGAVQWHGGGEVRRRGDLGGRARDLRHCAGPIVRQCLVQERTFRKLSSTHGTIIKRPCSGLQ